MEPEAGTILRKRKPNPGKANKNRKKMKLKHSATPKFKKPSKKMMQLYKKRAKAYSSDADEIEEDEISSEEEEPMGFVDLKGDSGSENEEHGEGYVHRQGITKFTDGCRAFKTAFMKIMKKNLTNDPLGPVLSEHKKLVAEKLAEEEADYKAKGEVKNEKLMVAEKGHIKPVGFLDAKEKLLISIATKGVVKLFNAVNKAQNPQKGLNPSKSKDVKALAKQRKETFLSELKKSSTTSTINSSKVSHFNKNNDEEPAWAPLRDGYMLTSSKLKDWDKMEDSAYIGGHSNIPSDESLADDD
ncbi:RRP15-like protein [Phalaenopsis equestris]|uniref:RRP15-like protein n=1 Tax=Phalaenopsis equestris TaxID=78828 RepID=UPI0009E3760A|nr:RRP15-like protein [Phalaenopsis equestris]XP_020589989.1 RRP15-like protein [Phalaenopsis equestris]XP_020589990.1 RRP15-like protein [Phalaenopsis equestris]XP_020589991.1 RRP15-like protein [Phalaenopsis equestris]